jgi:hypothetical protein
MSTTRSQRLKVRASQYLTAGYTPEFVAMVRATRAGQAHWGWHRPGRQDLRAMQPPRLLGAGA